MNADSDGDGLQDGTEYGRDAIVWSGDPANGIAGTDPAVFIPDADPSTLTFVRDADSDDDEIDVEELEKNADDCGMEDGDGSKGG